MWVLTLWIILIVLLCFDLAAYGECNWSCKCCCRCYCDLEKKREKEEGFKLVNIFFGLLSSVVTVYLLFLHDMNLTWCFGYDKKSLFDDEYSFKFA